MPYVQAADINTHYQQIGKGDVLVLLHGWANTWEAWSPLISELSKKYTLIIPDLPAFGKSSTPFDKGWDTHRYAEWLKTFMHTVADKKQFSFIGHSFGAKIASNYCFSNMSPLPKSLVLIGSSGIPSILTGKKKVISVLTKAVPRFLKDLLPDRLVKKFYKDVVGETDYANANTFQQQTLRKILVEDFSKDLQNITVPTLILWGEYDTASETEKSHIFHSNIPKSSLVVVANTGHFPHHDKPKEVLKELERFLK